MSLVSTLCVRNEYTRRKDMLLLVASKSFVLVNQRNYRTSYVFEQQCLHIAAQKNKGTLKPAKWQLKGQN